MPDNKPELVRFLLGRVEEILELPDEPEAKLQRICRVLADGITTFDWVGFYRADRERGELVLGPFVGAPTEHVRIPFGRGVCGQVAVTGEAKVVPDVRGETNYLSCSPRVRSEMVVPVFRGGEFVGELDVDSHTPDAFGPEEQALLEAVAERVGVLL